MKDNIKLEIKNLKILELRNILEHLKLGESHLKKILNEDQLYLLKEIGHIKEETCQSMAENKLDKVGGFALILNSIFTSIIGAWIGVVSFIGFSVAHKSILLFIILLSATIGAYFGYYNYKNNKKNLEKAMFNQQIVNIQLQIGEIVNYKYKNLVLDKLEKLNHIFSNLKNEEKYNFDKINYENKLYDDFSTKEKVIEWLEKKEDLINKKYFLISVDKKYDFYKNEIKKNKELLIKIILNSVFIPSEKIKDIKESEKSQKEKINQAKQETKEDSFIKILANPYVAEVKEEPKALSWIKTNFKSLLTGLLPTVIGGFGSIFVYFNGVPNLLKEIGFHHLHYFTNHPSVKPIELWISVIITVYFAYTFIDTHYKDFKRYSELNKTTKLLVNEEAKFVENSGKLNLFRKILTNLNKIHFLLRVLQEKKQI